MKNISSHNNTPNSLKKICAITMVRDDEFFLRKWIAYYGQQLGEENLYIFFDGTDQKIPEFCRQTHAQLCERIQGVVAVADKGRINFLSKQAALLLKKYDLVIGTDVDEFLVVDPALNVSLQEYLSSVKIKTSLSGLGIDVGQHLEKETAIDPNRCFLEQRHYGYLSSRYSKASVISRSVRWGSGFHRIKWHNFHIDKNLYLFHFGCIDLNMLKKRINETDRLENGWSRHLNKRAKTIKIITRKKALDWEPTVSLVRNMEMLFRPIYAINKPSTFGFKYVVNIPERFKKVL